MTLLSKTSRFLPGFSTNLMDFFNDDLDWGKEWALKTPAVNISESDKAYSLELAAPGLKKDDFQITIDNQQLSISCEKRQEEEKKEDQYTRKEFSYQSFRRSFVLPDSVDSDKIKASYHDGVLAVELPKKKIAVKAPKKQISVG